MKLTPIVAPSVTPLTAGKLNTAPGPSNQPSPRERAIAKMMENTPAQPQDTPVKNPSQVAPEEMSAIRSPSKPAGLNNTIEDIGNQMPPQEAPKAAEEPLSSQYAALARKERALRQREQQLKIKEAQLPKEDKQPALPQTDLSKFVDRERLVKDPFTVLNELGLTYEQLTELALNGPSQENMTMNNELRALREELKALKGDTESTKKTIAEQNELQRKQAITQLKAETARLVKASPEFETIKATNSISDVVELIERTFDEDGYLMTVEEAAHEVEDFLTEEALKLARLSKIQQKLAPKAAPVSSSTVAPQQQGMKTLTNSVSTSKPMSARERAILAMQGKLH
jgi:hypothetical protein